MASRIRCPLSLIHRWGAFGQSERGNIAGIVTDTTRAAIPNQEIIITKPATNTAERVTSTSTGEYNAANLSPGNYRIEVVAPGFKHFTANQVMVRSSPVVLRDRRHTSS